MHMQSENGRVAIIRSMETSAKRSAQHPGPSGSAEKDEEESINSDRIQHSGRLVERLFEKPAGSL